MLLHHNKIFLDSQDWSLAGFALGTVRVNISGKRASWKGIKTIPHPDDTKRVLYMYDSLAKEHKKKFEQVFGNVALYCKTDIQKYLQINPTIRSFFSDKAKVTSKKVAEYAEVVAWLEFLNQVRVVGQNTTVDANTIRFSKTSYKSKDWFLEHVCLPQIKLANLTGFKVNTLNTLKVKKMSRFSKLLKSYNLSCPLSGNLPDNFLRELFDFVQDGKVGTKKALKANPQVEQVIVKLATREQKPYATWLVKDFEKFIRGKITLRTDEGELIDPENNAFLKAGKPITLTDRTIRNILKKPENAVIIDSYWLSKKEFDERHRPYIHRDKPNYSLSKITIDDRVFPFKTITGEKVWAYWIFDVLSEVLIGFAVGTDKTGELMLAAIRNMFANPLIEQLGKMPAEIETEQHIASSFRDTLFKKGEVFDFVRFCKAKNAKEKHAEHSIKKIKYQQEKKRKSFQYRPFSKADSNRLNEDLNEKKNLKLYTVDEIKRNFLEDMYSHNHALHPNQNKYPGKSRLDVLKENVNPHLSPIKYRQIAEHIGEITETSIRKGYVRVQGRDHVLSDVSLLEQLKSKNVIAKWLRSNKNKVWIYQGDTYLDECTVVENAQTAQIETNEEYNKRLGKQQKYVANFDEWVEEKRATLDQIHVEEIEDNVVPLRMNEGDMNEEDIYDNNRFWGT